MSLRLLFILCLSLPALLIGCAGAPQRPVSLAPDVIAKHEGRVGVVMSAVPKIQTSYPGASCLLCLAAASMANSSLNSHAHTLTTDEVASYRAAMVEGLRKKGFTVVDVLDAIDVSKLPDAHAKSPDHPPKDFSSLKAKYNVDKLCVLEVTELGFRRNYAAYVPTGDPEAIVQGKVYMVDLSSNSYDWYQPIDVAKAADGKWNEPPGFPGLTNAYFQAVEVARDLYLGPFKN